MSKKANATIALQQRLQHIVNLAWNLVSILDDSPFPLMNVRDLPVTESGLILLDEDPVDPKIRQRMAELIAQRKSDAQIREEISELAASEARERQGRLEEWEDEVQNAITELQRAVREFPNDSPEEIKETLTNLSQAAWYIRLSAGYERLCQANEALVNHIERLKLRPEGQTRDRRGGRAKARESDGFIKCQAFLLAHHKYSKGVDGMEDTPTSPSEMENNGITSRATASRFFDKKFNGHHSYVNVCRDRTKLFTSLKLLAGDIAPGQLWNSKPLREGVDDRDTEADEDDS